jgi:L-rhamnose isomerase
LALSGIIYARSDVPVENCWFHEARVYEKSVLFNDKAVL